MNLSRHFNRLMASVVSVSLAATPLAGVGVAHAQNAPAAEAPGDSGWQKEFEAWRSASKAGKAADYEKYLKAYPTGKFASVAKKRIDEQNGVKPADIAQVDKQQTADTAQAETAAVHSTEAGEDDATKQRDLDMWRQVSKTGTQADYEKYLKAFPKGKFAKVAKTRIDTMIAAAKAPADQQTAETKQTPVQQDDQSQAQADDQNQVDDSNVQVTEQAQDQTEVKKKTDDNRAQAPASDWEQEYALWKAASDGNTVSEYEAYLKAYPNGKFAAIAQARIVQLAAAEQPANNIDEGDDTQAEQNNKVKQNQPADDQNQQADDQGQQTNDQNQQAQDQNQTDQGQDDQNQTADNQMDDQSPQQNDMGQSTQQKQQIQYTLGTPDTEDQFLNREGRHEIQGRLTSLGYDTFGSDGAFGPNTRTAIGNWQQDNGAPVSGYLSGDQIAQIRIQSQVSYAQWLNSQQVVVQRPVVVRPRREKIIVEERHPGVDAAIAAGVLGAVVLGAHRFKNRRGPGRVKVIGKFKMNNFFGGCRKKRRC
jgi:hypothetical protein